MLVHDSCIPITGLFLASTPGKDVCHPFSAGVYSRLAQKAEIEVVVLVARWTLYLERDQFDNGEGGKEPGKPIYVAPLENEAWRASDDTRRRLVSERYAAGIQELLRLGKTVILVYPIPEVGWNVPEYLARARLHGIELDIPLTTSFANFRMRNTSTYDALNAAGDDARLHRVEPASLLCDTYVKGRCVAQLHGVPLYIDDDHLSSTGATLVVNEIFEQLTRLQSQPISDDGRTFD